MIDIDQTIALLQDLIRIPSESSDQTKTPAACPEQALVEHLSALCTSRGIANEAQEVRPGRANFVARLPNPGAARLLIIAHLDTVSATGMADPFTGRIKDEKVWGRGACDDKGPLAMALSTLLQLHSGPKKLRYDITFAATVDEECSLAGAAALKQKIAPWDLCLCLEPTSLKIVKAHKGVYRCRISSHGKAVHSSTPGLGKNAILGMVEIISDLQLFGFRLTRHKHPDLGPATLAITQIKGGSSINTIPDHCEVSVDIRLLPEHHPPMIESTLQNMIGPRGTVETLFTAQGMQTDMANPLIKEFQEVLQAAGHSAQPVTASYATDCSELHDRGPCLVWGPGHIDQAHQQDEHIEISQLKAASQVLANFLCETEAER
jgi:acetylornithine deacetylase